jgi:hypothetical protein
MKKIENFIWMLKLPGSKILGYLNNKKISGPALGARVVALACVVVFNQPANEIAK